MCVSENVDTVAKMLHEFPGWVQGSLGVLPPCEDAMSMSHEHLQS